MHIYTMIIIVHHVSLLLGENVGKTSSDGDVTKYVAAPIVE